MKQIIIAISGRKGAGKNEISKHIQSFLLAKFKSLGYNNSDVVTGDSKIIECSFADTLKEFCIETLGLKREQCYGTDEEKNSPTQYYWDQIDCFLRWRFAGMGFVYPNGTEQKYTGTKYEDSKWFFWQRKLYPTKWYTSEKHSVGLLEESNEFLPVPHLRSGPMSGREVMQLFGTDLIRETFGNVWATATISRIKNSDAKVALIVDMRFPNEAKEVLKEECGFIVRLTRSPYGRKDEHPSEASLDDYDWKKDKCYIVDNAKLSIEEQNKTIEPVLKEILSRSV